MLVFIHCMVNTSFYEYIPLICSAPKALLLLFKPVVIQDPRRLERASGTQWTLCWVFAFIDWKLDWSEKWHLTCFHFLSASFGSTANNKKCLPLAGVFCFPTMQAYLFGWGDSIRIKRDLAYDKKPASPLSIDRKHLSTKNTIIEMLWSQLWTILNRVSVS